MKVISLSSKGDSLKVYPEVHCDALSFSKTLIKKLNLFEYNFILLLAKLPCNSDKSLEIIIIGPIKT